MTISIHLLFYLCMNTRKIKWMNEWVYRLIYSKSALHISGDVFAHHQEHLTVFTVSGSVHPSCCRLLSWMSWNWKFRARFSPIIRRTWLYLQYLVVFTQVAAGWCLEWVETESFGRGFRPSSGALDCIYSIWWCSPKLLPAGAHDLSRRAAADPRLRPRGHWDRHWRHILVLVNYIRREISHK